MWIYGGISALAPQLISFADSLWIHTDCFFILHATLAERSEVADNTFQDFEMTQLSAQK